MTETNIQDTFNYEKAFRRNRGFISEQEQKKLVSSTVAIAGVGGVGGGYVHALARLGVGNFKIADLDVFELSNFNRQMGATVPNIGRRKTDVYRELVQSINAEVKIETFDEGLQAENAAVFLEGADVILDALDFYCFKEREILYAEARKKNLFVVNIAPAGFGMTLMIFDPKGMTFGEYFDFKPGFSQEEKEKHLLFGVSPNPILLKYIDISAINMKEKGSFPCVSPAFFLAAGVAATEAIKILLGRGEVKSIPWVTQYDAYTQSLKSKYYPMGMQGPWQRLKRKIALSMLK